MKVLIFTIASWKLAIESKLVSHVMSPEANNEYQGESSSFEIEYKNSKMKVWDLAKELSLVDLEIAKKIILIEIENKNIGVLVDKILGIRDISFEKLPPYLILKGSINPIDGLNENSTELISLLNYKILENLIKENV